MIIMIGRIKKLCKLLPPLLSRDIKERYAGSALGIFWTFLQPLLFILIYWMVFSKIMKIRVQTDTGDVPFFAFLLSGILPWFALQEGVTMGATAILDKRHLIKKVIFPLELFPLSSVLSAFIHYGIGMIIFLSAYFFWKGDVSVLQILCIVFLIILQIFLTSGLALLFSALSVYIRDIIQILGVAFQVLFYISTILYPITSVPGSLKILVQLNPVTAMAEAYHSAILYNRVPELYGAIYLISFTLLAVASGTWVFRKLKKGFADVL
jgi:ABC-type polysaccharide/polyol phosphate export permease